MNEWLWPIATVVATVLGPILAVQAQKAIERSRERNRRKIWVFHQLMATRRARLSPEHVQALNMIDLAFYGRRQLGIHRPVKSEIAVTDAWHEYLDHLSTKTDDATWSTRGDELFTNILSAMAVDVGYTFDRVQLKKGAYSPLAHGELEQQQEVMRRLMIDLLGGDRSLKMQVTDFPFSDEATAAQIRLQSKLSDALEGEGALRVSVIKDHDAE